MTIIEKSFMCAYDAMIETGVKYSQINMPLKSKVRDGEVLNISGRDCLVVSSYGHNYYTEKDEFDVIAPVVLLDDVHIFETNNDRKYEGFGIAGKRNSLNIKEGVIYKWIKWYTEPTKEAEVKNKLNMYTIWSEGFVITGNEATAHIIGSVEAESFSDACIKLLGDRVDFNRDSLTLWGCKLFDNEYDARKNFG